MNRKQLICLLLILAFFIGIPLLAWIIVRDEPFHMTPDEAISFRACIITNNEAFINGQIPIGSPIAKKVLKEYTPNTQEAKDFLEAMKIVDSNGKIISDAYKEFRKAGCITHEEFLQRYKKELSKPIKLSPAEQRIYLSVTDNVAGFE